MTSRGLSLTKNLRRLTAEDEPLLRTFYRPLDRPLADLNSMMMTAWRDVLGLLRVIDDGILYVVARWDGQPTLWGPPIGTNVAMRHLERAFELLGELGAGGNAAILYVWPEYQLWEQIQRHPRLAVTPQAFEYVYNAADLAALRGRHWKTKRKERRRLDTNPSVRWEPYTAVRAEECLALIERWVARKQPHVDAGDQAKFEMEADVCRRAFRDRLDLNGVVLIVGRAVEGFSVGAPHGSRTFNCMFEKSNLDLPGSATALFSHLAELCRGTYDEINAGEDWNVGYLRRSKEVWKPARIQASHRITRR